MSNWSSSYLAEKYAEGEKELSIRLKCIVHRMSLSVQAGVNIYPLPEYCIGISRVTYLGEKLYPITLDEIVRLYGPDIYRAQFTGGAFEKRNFNNSAFLVGSLTASSIPSGRPIYYIYDSLGYKNITLFPFPSGDVAFNSGNLYTGIVIRNSVIIEFIRLCDTSGSTYRVPEYVRALLCKYYTLWKAFSSEGKGQDLNAASVYKDLFELNLNRASKLLQSQFAVHDKIFTGTEPQARYVPGKPRLPWNYGQVVR